MIETPSRPTNYAIVCNEVAQRDDLSARAKGIYYYLATLPSEWKLNKTELITHFVEGKKAINSAFKELETAGYIIRKSVKKEQGLFTGHHYKVKWGLSNNKEEITYQEYLQTSQWKTIAQKVRKRDGFKCVECDSKESLQVHHTTYENIFNENSHLDDLICVCNECHKEIHNIN